MVVAAILEETELGGFILISLTDGWMKQISRVRS